MRVVRHLEPDVWRQAVANQPTGNIFHTPEMFAVFERARGHKPELWAVTDGGQVLALLLPVQITLAEGPLRLLTGRAVAYGGLMYGADADDHAPLALLLDAYRNVQHRELFTELRHQQEVEAYQEVLGAHGFVLEPHQNFLVRLDLPLEQVWRNIHKSARKKIRQAQNKHALKILELRDRGLLPHWYTLLHKTYAHARIPLADRSLFEAALDILVPKGMAQFLLGQVDGECVAASVALLYKDTIYGWYRGFDRAYSAYLPNDLMVWHLLRWGVENGYRIFNFGGAGRPGQKYGPYRFKAKFGGELVNHGRSVYIHHPWRLKFSQFGYRLYQRLWLGRTM